MTLDELFTEIIRLRTMLLVSLGIVIAFFLIGLWRVRRFSVNGRRGWMAAFCVGLGGHSLLHADIVLVKFAVYSGLLLARLQPDIGFYWILGGMILLSFLLGPSIPLLLTEFFGGGIQIAGLVLCSYLLKYLDEIRYLDVISYAYWLMAALLILGSGIIFFREIMTISGERKYFDESGEIE